MPTAINAQSLPCSFSFSPGFFNDGRLRSMSAQRSPAFLIRAGMLRRLKVSGRDLAFLDLLPRARRRHRCAALRANGVCRGERRAVAVAAGVDVDAALAIDLGEFLRQVIGGVRHEDAADRVRESRNVAHLRLAVERHDDVEALRAGGLHPRRQPELIEQVAKADRRGANGVDIIGGRIEIEDADVRVIQIRHARDPHVLRDRVLVRHPQQRSLVGDHRMMDDAVLLRHLDSLEPVGKSLRDVLLPEALLADAGRVALHRDRAARDVRQDHRRHRLVIRRQVTLRDPIIREQDFFRMGDHDSPERANASRRIPSRRRARTCRSARRSGADAGACCCPSTR